MTVRVGMTGHQRLEDLSAWGWAESAIAGELDLLASPVTGVSSLAIGADQLFASLVARRGGKIHAIIPFPEYERTFCPEDNHAYHQILSNAASMEILETRGTDEDAYLAAGRRVVDLADLMFALWDGQPAKGRGGTADIVAYAIHKRTPLVHLNPVDRTITHR